MPFGGLLVLGGIAAASGISQAVIGSKASGNAADAQRQAEQQVLDLAKQTVPQANDLISKGTTAGNDILQKFYKDNLALLSPYLQAGSTAEGRLSAGLQPGGEFSTNPTADQILAQDPGYQFRLDQGRLALDRSASAKGQALGGGQLKALTQYGQDYASGEYGAAFNRYNTTQSNLFNRLNTLAGTGLSATGQAVGAGTQTAAGESANTTQGAGMQAQNLLQGLGIQGNALTGAANATASGYVGQANAINQGISGASQGISQAALLQLLLNKQKSTFD